MSRSKRLVGVAGATPLAVARSRKNSQVTISMYHKRIDLQDSKMVVDRIKWRLPSYLLLFRLRCTSIVKLPPGCLVAHGWKLPRWTTAVNVKRLLPPRQSRRNSHEGLGHASRIRDVPVRDVVGQHLFRRRGPRRYWWSHSPLILAAFMIGHHFSISVRCRAKRAPGVCVSGVGVSSPRSANRFCSRGSAKASATAALSLLMIDFGVPLGAQSPYQNDE